MQGLLSNFLKSTVEQYCPAPKPVADGSSNLWGMFQASLEDESIACYLSRAAANSSVVSTIVTLGEYAAIGGGVYLAAKLARNYFNGAQNNQINEAISKQNAQGEFEIPKEIQAEICSFLDPQALSKVERLSKSFQQMLQDKKVWENLAKRKCAEPQDLESANKAKEYLKTVYNWELDVKELRCLVAIYHVGKNINKNFDDSLGANMVEFIEAFRCLKNNTKNEFYKFEFIGHGGVKKKLSDPIKFLSVCLQDSSLFQQVIQDLEKNRNGEFEARFLINNENVNKAADIGHQNQFQNYLYNACCLEEEKGKSVDFQGSGINLANDLKQLLNRTKKLLKNEEKKTQDSNCNS